ncbi:MAG: Ig-like domain-containing protein [Oscillospiraceae bacterium]
MKKVKRILALVLAAVMMMTVLSATSFADQYDSAKALTSGKAVSGELARDNSITYKFTTNKEGTLKFDYSTSIKWLEVRVFDEDGAEISVDTLDVKVGKIIAGGEGNKFIDTEWNSSTQKTTASATFNVGKGTYYIKLWSPLSYSLSMNTESAAYKFTATFPSSTKTTEFSYLGITLKKGATMQLEAVNADAKNTTWTSSKKKVATVSSTGKITAKKAGTTIITCKCGDVTVKLKVTVK